MGTENTHTTPPLEFCSLYVTEDKASEAGTCYAQMSRIWWETGTQIRHNITTSLLTLHFTTFKSFRARENLEFHIVLIPFTSDNRWIVELIIFKSIRCENSILCHEKVSNVIKSHKMWLPWPSSCHGEARSQRRHLYISWHRRMKGTPVSCLSKITSTIWYFNLSLNPIYNLSLKSYIR